MPNSHFTASVNGSGEYDIIAAAWAAFIDALASGGVSAVGATLNQAVTPVPVPEPPTTEDTGPGNDVQCTAPDYDAEAHVTYSVGYTDDGYTFTDTTYLIAPGQTINIANGYNLGRQYTVLATGEGTSSLTPGALSTPLA